MIEAASSSGVATGIVPLEGSFSEKIVRTQNVQPGQMAGATDPRFAQRMPATNVPCMHA
jgi:hypothetical protein